MGVVSSEIGMVIVEAIVLEVSTVVGVVTSAEHK